MLVGVGVRSQYVEPKVFHGPWRTSCHQCCTLSSEALNETPIISGVARARTTAHTQIFNAKKKNEMRRARLKHEAEGQLYQGGRIEAGIVFPAPGRLVQRWPRQRGTRQATKDRRKEAGGTKKKKAANNRFGAVSRRRSKADWRRRPRKASRNGRGSGCSLPPSRSTESA